MTLVDAEVSKTMTCNSTTVKVVKVNMRLQVYSSVASRTSPPTARLVLETEQQGKRDFIRNDVSDSRRQQVSV